jgi:hypothetical protein
MTVCVITVNGIAMVLTGNKYELPRTIQALIGKVVNMFDTQLKAVA